MSLNLDSIDCLGSFENDDNSISDWITTNLGTDQDGLPSNMAVNLYYGLDQPLLCVNPNEVLNLSTEKWDILSSSADVDENVGCTSTCQPLPDQNNSIEPSLPMVPSQSNVKSMYASSQNYTGQFGSMDSYQGCQPTDQCFSLLFPPSSDADSHSSLAFEFPSGENDQNYTEIHETDSSDQFAQGNQNGLSYNCVSQLQDSHPPCVIVKASATTHPSSSSSTISGSEGQSLPLSSAHSAMPLTSQDSIHKNLNALDKCSPCVLVPENYTSHVEIELTDEISSTKSTNDMVEDSVILKSVPVVSTFNLNQEDFDENSTSGNPSQNKKKKVKGKTSDIPQVKALRKSFSHTSIAEKHVSFQSSPKLPKVSICKPVQSLQNSVDEPKGNRTIAVRRLQATKKLKLEELPSWSLNAPSKRDNHTKAGRTNTKSRCKAYELAPISDPTLERHRRNAINAKRNRDMKKEELNRMADELAEVKRDREQIIKEKNLLKLESSINVDNQAKLMNENQMLVKQIKQLQSDVKLFKSRLNRKRTKLSV